MEPCPVLKELKGIAVDGGTQQALWMLGQQSCDSLEQIPLVQGRTSSMCQAAVFICLPLVPWEGEGIL